MSKKKSKKKSRKKSNKRPLLIILALILIGIGGYAYYHYLTLTNVKNLDVRLQRAALHDITWTHSDLQFTIALHNPNAIKTTVGDFHASIGANEQPLATVELPAFTIQPQETITKDIPLRVSHFDVGLALFTAIKERRATWHITGTYTLLLPFGIEYDYAFSFTNDNTSSA